MALKRGITKMKLTVFDAHREDRAKPQPVADVESDGVTGQLVVHDQRFADVLRDVFEKPGFFMLAGGKGGMDGLAADLAVLFKPFSAEALESAVAYDLPLHKLRGAWVSRPRR